MHVWNVRLCGTRLAANTGRKNRYLGTIAQICWAVSSQLRHVSTIGKKLLNTDTSSTCLQNMVNFGQLAAEIVSLVWGTPANFNTFRVLAALLHGTLVVGVSQTASLNRGANYIRQAAITFGIGPHSSYKLIYVVVSLTPLAKSVEWIREVVWSNANISVVIVNDQCRCRLIDGRATANSERRSLKTVAMDTTCSVLNKILCWLTVNFFTFAWRFLLPDIAATHEYHTIIYSSFKRCKLFIQISYLMSESLWKIKQTCIMDHTLWCVMLIYFRIICRASSASSFLYYLIDFRFRTSIQHHLRQSEWRSTR